MTIKKDKIFDNTYGKKEIDGSKTSFRPDDTFREKRIDEKIDEMMIERILKEAIDSNEDVSNMIEEYEEKKKLSKKQMNEFFRFCYEQKGVCGIEAFSYITKRIEIREEKLYDSLSNHFKMKLIEELRERGYVKDTDKSSLF